MAVKRCASTLNVVQAAEMRIRNVFNNGLPVYLSFSAGKDSLCIAQMILNLAQRGEIDISNLIVHFIDEEAIFPCMEAKAKEWRTRFMLLGAKFEWYCLEVKHFNCFNQLTNDETFICWDSRKQDVWVRQPPSFAIRSHPLLNPRIDAYQNFLPRIECDGVGMIGIRTAESVQRLQNIAKMLSAGKTVTANNQVFPIYDWKDSDVWKYLYEEGVDIPEIYLYLWQSGTRRNQLRVSQFFSVDTARSLVKMNEYYPELMDRVIRREPNAYLAALYWDSEMFGRSTKARRELETVTSRDYKAEFLELVNHIDKYFESPHQKRIAKRYRDFFLKCSTIAEPEDYKKMYEALIGGDPKERNLRALYQSVFGKYISTSKKEGAAQ